MRASIKSVTPDFANNNNPERRSSAIVSAIILPKKLTIGEMTHNNHASARTDELLKRQTF
jgi:hypothetical protein